MAKLEECIADIWWWMDSNLRQLNDKKTKEVIFLRTFQNLSRCTINSAQIVYSTIEASQHVCNIGAVFDQHLKMEQITVTCKQAWFRLYQIVKIRPYLSIEERVSILYAYIISFDQNNRLLVGCLDSLINRLKKCKMLLPNWSSKQNSRQFHWTS